MKLIKLLSESQQIPDKINVKYYQKLIDMSPQHQSNTQFMQKVLNSIKKKGGKVTPRQYMLLKRFANGGDPYSTKN